jgi:hypothetical protein
MRTVNERLVAQGLERYRPLVNFNRNLIWVSISCDAMIIGLMSLPNSFVYSKSRIRSVCSVFIFRHFVFSRYLTRNMY